MAVTMYTRGLDITDDFNGSSAYRALLVTASYTVNRDHDFVSDITNEITASGYARETLTSCTRTLDDTLNRITYDAADPDFGTITTGQAVVGMVVYKFVTNDADSILVGYYPLASTDTAALAPFVVTLGADGLFYTTGS